MAGAQAARTPKGIRKDPPRKHLDGLSPWNEVRNPDPGFKYVLVSAESPQMGPEYYEMLGYDFVTYQGDKKPRLAAGRYKEGDKIVSMGQYLMCIPDDKYEELYQYGVNGQSGQEQLDRISASTMDPKRGGIEAVRSKSGIHASQMSSGNIEEDVTGFLS